jgi:hypothetical protein
VLILVHGALRDADRYFAVASAAAEGDRSTFIVAPQFLAHVDREVRKVAPAATLFWDVEGWKGGEPALGPAPVSSFTAMDCLLQQLTAAGAPAGGRTPAVVIIGNSAGGQYVNRYAAVGHAPDALAERGIPVRFVISNPSTYLYFDGERPAAAPDVTGSTAGATDSMIRLPTSAAPPSRACGVTSRAMSPSSWAPRTAMVPRCCSK